MRFYLHTICIFLLIIINNIATAYNGVCDEECLASRYIEFSVGASTPQINNTQTTVFKAAPSLQPEDVANTYNAGSALLFSIAAGRQFPLHVTHNKAFLAYYRLGLRYANQRAENLDGQGYWPNYAKMHDVYTYNYNIKTQYLLADLALGLYRWQRFSSYLHLALGVAFVQAGNYKETAGTDLPGKVSYAFIDQHTNKLGSMIGLGASYSLSANWQALITYDYFPPISVALGNGTPLTYVTPLGPKISLENQTISLGLRYVF